MTELERTALLLALESVAKLFAQQDGTSPELYTPPDLALITQELRDIINEIEIQE